MGRAGFRGIHARFQGTQPTDSLDPATRIRAHLGTIYIDTHINPSAGCVIVLPSKLTLKTAISGCLLGFIADYAIVRGSEVHCAAVHPARQPEPAPTNRRPPRSRISIDVCDDLGQRAG